MYKVVNQKRKKYTTCSKVRHISKANSLVITLMINGNLQKCCCCRRHRVVGWDRCVSPE